MAAICQYAVKLQATKRGGKGKAYGVGGANKQSNQQRFPNALMVQNIFDDRCPGVNGGFRGFLPEDELKTALSAIERQNRNHKTREPRA